MKLKDIQQNPEKRKTVRMYIRTSPENAKWMKKKQISPQLLWDVAFDEFKKQGGK